MFKQKMYPVKRHYPEGCMTPNENDIYMDKMIKRYWIFYTVFLIIAIAFCFTFLTGCTSTPSNHATASMVKTAGNTAEYMEFWARH